MSTQTTESIPALEGEIDSEPHLVSVDDHIAEPPTLWSDRLPSRYREIGPRVVRERAPSVLNPGTEMWVDAWYYEDNRYSVEGSAVAAGRPPCEDNAEPMLYEDMRPGCFQVEARLRDMDVDGVEASVCFPNLFVRFCGQRFSEAKDKDLALLCVRAYNDWLVEEWAEPSNGRLVPSAIIPLWDVDLAVEEIWRNAARNCPSVCFSEIPARLGLPSMYSGYWDPFFEACDQTGTVINVHIGSSSRIHTTSDDAPIGIRIVNHFSNSSFSLCDWLISGAFIKHPNLRVALSEGQAGWIPYVLTRLDGVWNTGAGFLGFDRLPDPPSTYFEGHVYACVFSDPVATELIDRIGEDSLCFETDYPHNDGSWPNSRESARRLTQHMSATQREKVLRINGARLYRIERVLNATNPSHTNNA
jgi:predicted TIM-barrel fold metal-dependent hydrolase